MEMKTETKLIRAMKDDVFINFCNQLENVFEVKFQVRLEVDELWLIFKNIDLTSKTLPILLKQVMEFVKILQLPNWQKKELVTICMQEFIRFKFRGQEVLIVCMQSMIPQLIDTLCEINKSNHLFKKKIKNCCV